MYLLRVEWIDNFSLTFVDFLRVLKSSVLIRWNALVETHLDSGSITPFLPMGTVLLHEGTILPMEVVY